VAFHANKSPFEGLNRSLRRVLQQHSRQLVNNHLMQQKPTLRRALQIVVFNTVIAIGIATFMGRGLWENLIYSQCIGLSIWALIDFAQYWLIKDISTQWRRLFWLVPICAALGYLVGTLLAQIFFPQHQLSFLTTHPNQALGFLVISLMAGAASTYFFMSREQLASARLALEKTQRDIEAAQRQAAQAQLRLLQSQLEPHMLFNTLANLRVLITLDPPRAQEMLDHLVDYLRATLTASRATAHPLRTEFERLRDYLELIKVRMGARLRYTLDLPPELAELTLPPLLLQALVENAIKHGLEPKVEGGSITVRASRKAGRVSLTVQDTGVGLGQGAAVSPTTGFGLAQVRERLETRFGPNAKLELIAMKPCGTSAEATFDAD
jgi:sensor histidine kinase YesM